MPATPWYREHEAAARVAAVDKIRSKDQVTGLGGPRVDGYPATA